MHPLPPLLLVLLAGAAPGPPGAVPTSAPEGRPRWGAEGMRPGAGALRWDARALPPADTFPRDAGAGSSVDTFPRDAFLDPAVRGLVGRARAARGRPDSAILSHEVTWRERVYVGLSVEGFRRERGLLNQERAARIRWSADGVRHIRWLGTRRRSPFGDAEIEFERSFDFLDPSADRLFLGADGAVHPLADSAGLHYRYRSGDTLRIELPSAGRTVTLVEAVVEPREARFDLVAGSLWFDLASAALVRAAYRPARPFDMDADEPEDADEVPGFLRPVRATVDYVVVDYGLQDLSWWLPHRLAFEGTVQLGEMARFPFRAEWSFGDYAVNVAAALDTLPEPRPGWRRIVRVRDGDSVRVVETVGRDTVRVAAEPAGEGERAGGREGEAGGREGETDGRQEPGRWTRLVVVVPPPDSLAASPELPAAFGRGDGATEELSALRDRIGRASVPSPPRAPAAFAWGSRFLRYNRVEGPSAGAGVTVPVTGHIGLEATARLGLADLEPNAALRLVREGAQARLALGAYRRLTPVGDWGRPLGLGNSAAALLAGRDEGLYFRGTGAELVAARLAGPARWEARLFAERQRTAAKRTDLSLPGVFGDEMSPNIRAERADLAGVSGRVRLQTGADPARATAAATAWAEAAAGDFRYGRLAGSAALVTATTGDWVGALELGAGTTAGTPPRQRRWFLGGAHTIRGLDPGALEGETFWLARAEVGRAFGGTRSPIGSADAPLRVLAFLDAGRAGAAGDDAGEGTGVGAGLGLSLLDGLLRMDLARGLEGGGWRLHLYTDGLL